MRVIPTLLLLSLCACATPAKYDYAKEPDPRRTEYVVGPADHLSVQVWRMPDVSRDVVVRPDGTVTLPLIGDVQAGGQTTSQLQMAITRLLSKYVKDEGAVVTVAVTAVNSYNYTVSGSVERAGTFTSPRYVTVLEAMQMAGGPNRFASPSETKLIRREPDGTQRIIPINYPAVVDGSQPEANLPLLAGDQIFVP